MRTSPARLSFASRTGPQAPAWAMAFAIALLAIGGCDSDPAVGPAADTAAPDADVVAADATAPDADAVDPSPGLGIDYGQTAPGATPRFDAGASDWLATGWPTDRLVVDGRLDLSAFRGIAAGLFDTYLDLGERVLDGYSLNGAVYFELDDLLDAATLPAASATTSPTSVIQLVNATAGSPRFGERLPLLFRFYDGGFDRYYRPRTLAMRPVYGFPLAERETYCAIVTRAVKDADGRYLQAAPGFLEALDDDPHLAALRAWLPTSPLRVEDLATATCFTTHAPTEELRRIGAWVEANPPAAVERVDEPGVFNEFHGVYRAPNFQSGVKPYAGDGEGEIHFDAAGDPVVQAEEALRFLLIAPRDRPMPEAGWPVVLYSHGTGGDYESCRSVVGELNASGHAVLCIDQPLHGPRGPDLDDNGLVLYSFNFINPSSGRSSFRQAAADTLVLSRMLAARAFDLPAEGTRAGMGLRLDPERITFFGHSHGGLSGALALAVDARIRGAVISGAAGVLVETILRRKDPADIAALVRSLLGIAEADLDSFHPAMTLVQTLVDATDPINYAPLWLRPVGDVPPKHIFVTEGTEDDASPSVGTDALGAAGGLPLIGPNAKESAAHTLRGLATVDAPVAGNAAATGGATRTAAMRQWQHGNHFVAFQDAEARAMWNTFFRTFFDEGGGAGDLGAPVIGSDEATLLRSALVAGGDTCGEAGLIAPEAFPVAARGNTSLAGADLASAGCGGDPLGADGRDLVWRFEPPVDGTYRFRLSLPPAVDRDTPRYGPNVVYVTAGCGGGATCLGQRAGGSLDLELEAGATYHVVVDGAGWVDKGTFALIVEQLCDVRACDERECGAWGCGDCGACDDGERCTGDGVCEARPVGDTCADAIAVDALPFRHSGDTTAYASRYGYSERDCPGFPFRFGNASSDVVYRFTAPAAGTYRATLDGTFDTSLFAVTDCADVAGSCLGAARDPFDVDRLLLHLGAGESAFIIADGSFNNSDTFGAYTFGLDLCEPDCEGKVCGDDGCGGSCGSCGPALSCVEERMCAPIPSTCEQAGACEDTPGDTCEQAFVVGELPYSDTRNTADFRHHYGYGVGWCPGVEATWGLGAQDVAYAFTAAEQGLYRFQLDTGTPPVVFDANLYLVTDCDDIEGSCLAADERARNERVWREFEAGEQAFVIVDGWSNTGGQSGRYTLDVRRCVPSCADRVCGGDGCNGSCGGCGANEACSGGQCVEAPGLYCELPRGVGELPWRFVGSTVGWQDNNANLCGNAAATGDGSPDVTFAFEAPADGTYRARVEADFDAQVYVVPDCSDPATCLGGDGVGLVKDMALTAGQRVQIVVDGASAAPASAEGAFTLWVEVACFPQCDGKACGPDGCGGECGACAFPSDICGSEPAASAAQCVDPTAIAGNTCEAPFEVGALPFSAQGDTREAYGHYETDDGACAGWARKGAGSAEQVWRFAAPAAGRYEVAVAPSGWDGAVYAVRDCADIAGTCVAADDGQLMERLTLDLGAGETVFIVVDGEHNVLDSAGPYLLWVDAAL